MPQTVIVNEVNLKGYNLSVTLREAGDSPEVLEELAYRTIGLWLWIAQNLEQGVYKLPSYEGVSSVESRYQDEINDIRQAKNQDTDEPSLPPFAFRDTYSEPRVTVWDSYRGNKRVNFHLNSDDDLQTAVNTWVAAKNAIERSVEKWGDVEGKVKNTPQSNVAPQNSSAASQDKPATPKSQNAPQNAGNSPLYTKKDAIAKLNAGDKFKMKIVQIEKHSKDGKDFYDFFEPYGGKAGQFSAASVFTDNEGAINSGFIASLDALGIKPGQALTGNWTVNCAVGKPKTKTIKGEEKTFVNIYVNSFEVQG